MNGEVFLVKPISRHGAASGFLKRAKNGCRGSRWFRAALCVQIVNNTRRNGGKLWISDNETKDGWNKEPVASLIDVGPGRGRGASFQLDQALIIKRFKV